MSARLDFEARLRALRAPKSPASASEVPAAVGPSAVSASSIDYGSSGGSSARSASSNANATAPEALAWPSVPLAPSTTASTRHASFSTRRDSSGVAVDEHGWPAAPNMTVQRTEDGWPEVPSPLKSDPPAIRVVTERRRPSTPMMGAQPAASPERTTIKMAAAPPSWLPQRSYQQPAQQPQEQRQASQLQQQPSHPQHELPEEQRYQPQQQQQQQQQHYQPSQEQHYQPPQQPVYQQYEQQQSQPTYEQYGVQTQSPPTTQAQQQYQASMSLPQEPERQVSMQLLGPEYSEAVRVAQRAIENERLRHVHTAIDDYILAGQLLISIGRQQHQAPHLQDVVKKKALALLQRAEGLAAWIHQVQALDASQQALDAAFEASQANQDRALSEQEALVSKMRSDNDEMKQRLNQLVVLTKTRTRLRRMVRERRAQKEAEAAAAGSSSEDPVSLSSTSLDGPDLNDVEGMSDEEDEDHVDQWYDRSGSSVADDDEEYARMPLPSSVASFRQSEPAATAAPSSQEEQKVMLVNELRSAIGLPEIDHLRKFEPLSADPTGDAKQERLQQDLEKARKEAEELRAAVQSMERCLRLAAQHSKQRSIKMEQEKQEDLARVRRELEHVREQLEQERRMSSASSMGSRRSSIHSDIDAARDREEFENTDVMRGLRSSLFKVFSHKKSRESANGSSDVHANGSGRSVVQRTSEAQSSPRHRATSSSSKPHQMQRQQPHRFDSDGEPDEDDDGGVWL